MVATALIGAPALALVAGVVAMVLALVGLRRRRVATVAVAATIVPLALGNPSAVAAVIAGFAAAMYLITVHAIGAPAGVAIVDPSVIGGAAMFALLALIATAFPSDLAWLPLLAPVTVALLYVAVLRPLVESQYIYGNQTRQKM